MLRFPKGRAPWLTARGAVSNRPFAPWTRQLRWRPVGGRDRVASRRHAGRSRWPAERLREHPWIPVFAGM